MEDKKKVGRPTGINKSVKYLGYKYTPEEHQKMVEALEKYKAKHNCTTSKALYKIILNSIK